MDHSERKACTLHPSSDVPMQPLHKSGIHRRRSPAIAVELKVPALCTTFGALAASVRPEGVFLSTYQELEVGTSVVATLSLPDGPLTLEGVIVERNDPSAMGVAVAFDELDDAQRMRLEAASSLAPAARVA